MKKFDENYIYLKDMYNDSYFPKFLVDKVKQEIVKVVEYLEEEGHTTEDIQKKFDIMTTAINDLQEEFDENGSEIETAARESIRFRSHSPLKHSFLILFSQSNTKYTRRYSGI